MPRSCFRPPRWSSAGPVHPGSMPPGGAGAASLRRTLAVLGLAALLFAPARTAPAQTAPAQTAPAVDAPSSPAPAPAERRVLVEDLALAQRLDSLGMAAYQEGRYSESARLLSRRASLPGVPGTVNAAYNAACSLALAGDREGALEQLEAAADAGLGNPGFVAADGDLASLHGDPRWEAVLARLEHNRQERQDKMADPDRARLVTEDLPRFWRAFDLAAGAETDSEREAIFAHEYLEPGTAGLLDFFASRIHSVELLAAQAEGARPFLDRVRTNTLRPLEQTEAIRSAFRRLEAMYPEAVFPDVYFLVGRFTSGGTTAESGLLIGVELFALDDDTPPERVPEGLRSLAKPASRIPYIVAHELTHYQQPPHDGTLLGAALREGGADFVAELIHPDGGLNNYQEWGQAHARQVAARFLAEMDALQQDGGHRDWFYNYHSVGDDWFPDLGYYVGWEICRGYYERAQDKDAALRDLLLLRDPKAILAASGYVERFAEAASTPGD